MQPEFNLAEGQRLKDEGMSLTGTPSQANWRLEFNEYGTTLALCGAVFTAEDIVHKVGLPPTSSNSVGAAMNALARSLGLKRVGFRQAKRPSRHAAIVAVWQLPN